MDSVFTYELCDVVSSTVGVHIRGGVLFFFFFFKQKTAYEMRISDWSSDVCSSDLWIISAPRNSAIVALPGIPSVSVGIKAVWAAALLADRSEERRVGKECVSTCRSRWSPYH